MSAAGETGRITQLTEARPTVSLAQVLALLLLALSCALLLAAAGVAVGARWERAERRSS